MQKLKRPPSLFNSSSSQSQSQPQLPPVPEIIFIILSTFAINYIHVRARFEGDGGPRWMLLSWCKRPRKRCSPCMRAPRISIVSMFTSEQQRRAPYIGRLNWPLAIESLCLSHPAVLATGIRHTLFVSIIRVFFSSSSSSLCLLFTRGCVRKA